MLKGEDGLLSELAALYERRGYSRYKPGCFEDYSLYLRNIDFLADANVLAFGGAEGRVLALRPDVTLSVISRVPSYGEPVKLFYAEKVYRRPEGGGEFRDINQAGVEVIGRIDAASEAEVAAMITDTLSAVSEEFFLDISHMGYTEGLMKYLKLSGGDKDRAYACLRGKNTHDFKSFAKNKGMNASQTELFCKIAAMGGRGTEAVREVSECAVNDEMKAAADELFQLLDLVKGTGCSDRININFSAAGNADYYNGIIFNGYVGGVPRRVLSGGRYDKLLKRMGKSGGAIGFALYLGELERIFAPEGNFADVLILYDDDSQAAALAESKRLLDGGNSVRIARSVPETFGYGKVLDLREGVK